MEDKIKILKDKINDLKKVEIELNSLKDKIEDSLGETFDIIEELHHNNKLELRDKNWANIGVIMGKSNNLELDYLAYLIEILDSIPNNSITNHLLEFYLAKDTDKISN